MERNKFIFYKDWWDAMTQMPEEMRRAIIEAIMNYALYGIDTDDPQIAYSIYALAKAQIDRDTVKYDAIVEKRREAGRKGMAKRWGNKDNNDNKCNNDSKSNNDNKCYHLITNVTPITNITNNSNIDNDINNDINKDNIVINDNNKNNIGQSNFSSTAKSEKAAKRFIPPTPEQVAEYVAEKGYNVDPNTFVDFYTAKGWMIGRNPMKDWKAAVRTWNKNERNATNYGTTQVRPENPGRPRSGSRPDEGTSGWSGSF